jgi:hypothetical protein
MIEWRNVGMRTGKYGSKIDDAHRQAPASASFPGWLESESWRLPCGQPLVEFALQAGFLASRVLQESLEAESGDRPERRRRVRDGVFYVDGNWSNGAFARQGAWQDGHQDRKG